MFEFVVIFLALFGIGAAAGIVYGVVRATITMGPRLLREMRLTHRAWRDAFLQGFGGSDPAGRSRWQQLKDIAKEEWERGLARSSSKR